jgi:hypothetical protein
MRPGCQLRNTGHMVLSLREEHAGPNGLPRQSLLATAGDYGYCRRPDPLGSNHATYRVVIPRFPEDTPDERKAEVWSEAEKARQAAEEDRKAEAKRRHRFRLNAWKRGKDRAKRNGATPPNGVELGDPFWIVCAAAGTIQVLTEMGKALPVYHIDARRCASTGGTGDHGVCSPRRPSPVAARGEVTRTTGGADKERPFERETLLRSFPDERPASEK